MYKKTITYTDFNGNERTEDFYFNLMESELAEMEYSKEGGMEQYLKRIVNAQDTKALVKEFKEIVLLSYGEKSDDGKRFIKSPELSEAFSQTEAYSKLFMLFATNDEEAAAFVNGIIPAKLSANVKETKSEKNQE